MTASVPIMRPHHCRTVLHVSIWAALLLTLNADSDDSTCDAGIEVRRNTVYEAVLGEDLRISCPVVFCNNSPPTVSWVKLGNIYVPVNVSSDSHIKTEWEKLNNLKGISYLIFKNILRSDSGGYSCSSEGSVSHAINVTVNDRVEATTVTQKNNTNGTSVNPEHTGTLWMYVNTAAGIVAFVVVVIIISVASMRGCKGKSKKETRTDNQYMAIPMVEQPLPRSSLQASPRGSPSAPPSRRSARTKASPSRSNELPLPRDNEHLYGEIKEERERQRNTAEDEGSSIVYAALNHQLPARPAPRPRRLMEESSEYAAIRVKDL